MCAATSFLSIEVSIGYVTSHVGAISMCDAWRERAGEDTAAVLAELCIRMEIREPDASFEGSFEFVERYDGRVCAGAATVNRTDASSSSHNTSIVHLHNE